MSWLTDIFKGSEPTQLKLHDSSVRHIIPKVPLLDHSIESLATYATKSELVYSCIEKKAQSACDPELIIQIKKGDGEWEAVDEHPALTTLQEPNKWDDGESFLRSWIASENISGEFYAEIVRSKAGVPVELYPLRPDYIFPQYVSRNGFDVLDYYAYRINGREIKYRPEELLIRRRHGLGSMYSGVSPLYVALGAVDADIASTEYIRAFFNNGGTPSGIINVTDRNLSEEEMAGMQQKWVNRYGRGGKMRGGPAILDGSTVSYEPIGANLDTLNSESLTSIDETRICMAFGVPPVLIGAYVGLKNVNQKASFKGAMEEFWMNTMSPELKTLRKFLTKKYLPLYGQEVAEQVARGDIRFFWDMDSVWALQEDLDGIHERARSGYNDGIITLNEARAMVGFDEVDEEIGDTFKAAPVEPEEEEVPEEEVDEDEDDAKRFIPELKQIVATIIEEAIVHDPLDDEFVVDPSMLSVHERAFSIPAIEGDVLDQEISVTFENESGKTLTRQMTVGERQKQLQKKNDLLKKILVHLHNA